jgi:hypothetical protein
MPYNMAPHSLKKFPQKPFFVKGFGDGGVGEGPFIKRSFPHEKKHKHQKGETQWEELF